MALLRCLAALFLCAVAHGRSYSVQLSGGRTGASAITGLNSYTGDFRVDARFKNCVNPNDGATHNLIGAVGSLRWSSVPNRLEVFWWQDTGAAGNAVFLDATSFATDWEVRFQRVSATRISLEKWDAAGEGYEVHTRPVTGTNPINFANLTLGSAGTGCEVAFLRVYLDDIPLGSAPPSAIKSPDTGALRSFSFDDQVSPAPDRSGNGGTMTFSSTPAWAEEDTSLACWAVADGSLAGAPVPLASYVRGSVASRTWEITSQPPLEPARLSSYTSATPLLENVVAGTYSVSLTVDDVDGRRETCATTQTFEPPPAGLGGYQRYTIGTKLSAAPGTAQFRISVVQPTGEPVAGSPYFCSSDPCSITIDDTGMGEHIYRIERLNSHGAVLSAGNWTPLVAAQVPAKTVPAPKRPSLPLMEATAFIDNGPRAGQFVADRFDLRIGGAPNPRTWNPHARWAQYRDFSSFYYLAEYWKIRDHAAVNNWPYEDYMLHCSIDHRNSHHWTKVAKFGEDQPDSLNRATKGVMISKGSSFIDKSEDAWSTRAGDVPLGNKVYIGYPEPFDLINVVIGTARSGGSVAWEYWNGSAWSTLTVTDGSSGFSRPAGSTVYAISFMPPVNWAPTSVNGSRNRFYVRALISRASTTPVASRIYGDTWETNTLERGWNSTDPNIITVAGGYAYNPTPPTGATAKFRYQARVRSFWPSRNDAFLANDDSQATPGGTKYWPRYLADGTVESFNQGQYNALFLDNGDSVPENVSAATLSAMDWATPYTPKARRGAMGMAMKQIVSRVKAAHPNAWIGANVPYRRASVCFQLDFCHFENQVQAASQYDYSNNYGTDGDLLATFGTLSNPELNTRGTVGFIVVQSNETIDPLDGAGNFYWWDRADRRPITALATFYLGWNGDATTGFSYNAHGFTYSQDDNFYYMCCDTVTTTAITGSRTTTPQKFDVADTSQLWNPATRELAVVIGNPPDADYVGISSWTGKTLTTNGIIHHDWPTGTRVTIRKEGRQGSMLIPRDRLLWQSIWFDAMAAELGVPTGPHNLSWKTPSEYGGSAGSTDLRMRPYSKGIVILRPVAAARSAARMNECSNAVDLDGTYYRLHADGKTEAAPYTSIKLREGEAFIGLKTPTAKSTEIPAWQQNPCP